MELNDAIEKLKKYIAGIYDSTGRKIGTNIFRGHLRSISSDVEDGIALFIADILSVNYSIFLDSSININGSNNRPDLLLVDGDNTVRAMIEIKANMGWCRNASAVIDDIKSNDIKFRTEKQLTCKFSREEEKNIIYGDNVILFLIAFSDSNCNGKNHKANKLYASNHNVFQFNLFSGWYESLINCEIEDFGNEIISGLRI